MIDTGTTGSPPKKDAAWAIKWTRAASKEQGDRYVLDPTGDILLLVGGETKRIQVSSSLLVSFSPVFKAMLMGRFKEGIDFKQAFALPFPWVIGNFSRF
jgi:hypothetical protein